jgi:hypothetical protein
MIKRHSEIEPTIGHIKTVDRLPRNPLKGALGQAIRVISCHSGNNIDHCERNCGFFLPSSHGQSEVINQPIIAVIN